MGDNLNVLGQIANRIWGILEKIPHVRDIQDNYESGTPTVRVRVDKQKAAMYGLSTNTVGFALKVAFNGIKASTYREGDDDYDITVQLAESERKVTDILRELLILPEYIPMVHTLSGLVTMARFMIAT